MTRITARDLANTTWAVCLVGAFIAIGICAYDLSLPNALAGVHGTFGAADGYDDGVYLGIAIRLIHGVVPYRDFVIVQPPGIGILMTPIAAIGQAIGDRGALILTRLLTMVIAGANAFLVGWILRHCGRAAMLAGSILLACFPLALAATSTLTLEPYLVFFCLLGVALIYPNGEIGATRAVFIGGLAFGIAGAVKLWAILPVIALVLALLPRWKSAIRPAIVGIAIGFVVFTLPFVVMAPSAFFHDVVGTQLIRAANGAGGTGGSAISFLARLKLLTGTPAMPNLQAPVGLAEFVGVIVALCILLAAISLRRPHSASYRFVVICVIVVLAGMFLPHDFYDHYAYFPAAFVALFIGAFVGEVRSSLDRRSLRMFANHKGLRTAIWFVAPFAIFAVIAATLVQQETSFAATYLGDSFNYNASASALIPPGSCVVTDFPSLLVDLNRYSSDRSNCPDDIDPLGIWLADDNGAVPRAPLPYPESMVNHFDDELLEANYAVLSIPTSDYLPWTPSLISWFSLHYRPIFSQPGTYIYLHTSDFAPGARPQT